MFKGEIIGNLGADAVLNNGNDGKFVTFRVAHSSVYTDRSTGQQVSNTIWVSCSWNSDGGNLLQYLKTGTKVYVRGNVSSRLFVGNDGQKHAGINITVQEIELVGSRATVGIEDVSRFIENCPQYHEEIARALSNSKAF